MTEDDSASDDARPTAESIDDFLLSRPPGQEVFVPGGATRYSGYNRLERRIIYGPLQLYCGHRDCGQEQHHDPDNETGAELEEKRAIDTVSYTCRNCGSENKNYSLMTWQSDGETLDVICIKIGEYPVFGPRVTSRVANLVKRDRELFLKGRRSESHGLGIGAYGYYRQVVENQWQSLVGEILKVATRIKASPDVIESLTVAKCSSSLGKAVTSVKDAIPPALLIDGHHNPLTLLNDALSFGLHPNLTDDECLQAAQSIRVVLTDLAERMDQALQDHEELAQSVKNLQALRAKKARAKESSNLD